MRSLCLYRSLTVIAAPLIEFYLRRRRSRGKEHPLRYSERYGIASLKRPNGPLFWLHAASIGEAQSALSLIRRILASEKHLNILMTTGTVTSAKLLENRLPGRSFHQFVPVDKLAWVHRFLDYWQPDLAFWIESELWPNLVIETQRRGIPAILVNGRMSERSFANWRYAQEVIHFMLRGFSLCFAQTESEAKRLTKLGARDVLYHGNLKYSAAALPFDREELDKLKRMSRGRRVWLAASTHPGEELMAGNVHIKLQKEFPNLLTIIVPRHPYRGKEISKYLSEMGLNMSLHSEGNSISTDIDIYVADTLGDLGLYYRLSDIAFIGGSMNNYGGHNPLEAAQLDCAIIHGPDMANFSTVAEQLAGAGGTICVSDTDTLYHAVHQLLTRGGERANLARAAKKIAHQNSQVVDRVFEDLIPHINAVCSKL